MIATDAQLFPNLRVSTAGRVAVVVHVSDFAHSGMTNVNYHTLATTFARALKVTIADQNRVLIANLPTRDFSLKAPLSLILVEDEGEYRAELPEVELYAFAGSEWEAIGELLEEFVDLCKEILPKRDVELGASAKRWKHFLASIVK